MSLQVVFKNVRFFPMMSMASYMIGMVLAYLVAVALDHVEPILPFISHVLAYPPQTAFGIIFGWSGALLGILSIILRYVIVNQRARSLSQNKEDNSVQALNKASMCFGILSLISMLLIMMWPVGFPGEDQSDFVVNTAVPHHLGDFFAFVFFSLYVFTETYVTFIQRSIHKENLLFHIAVLIGVIVSGAMLLLYVYPALSDVLKSMQQDTSGIFQFIYKKYSFEAFLCAVFEWVFVVLCLTFVASFYKDFKNVSVHLRLIPKQRSSEPRESSPSSSAASTSTPSNS